jgi:hypothetical protein
MNMKFWQHRKRISPPLKRLFFSMKSIIPKPIRLMEDQLVPQYQFDFGKYSIPERFFEMDFMAGFELLNQQGFAFISQYWENEDKAFFGVDVQVNGELKKHQVILG